MEDQSQSTGDPETVHQELSEREAELAIINSVQEGLASHLDVQEIYNLVGDKIRDIFNSQVVMISTYDPETETIEHRYAFERGEHIYAPGRYPIRGFRTQVVQTRKPVLANRNVAELAARMGQHTIPGTITPKAWLGVPMIVGDQVTGILSLQNLDREDAFDQSDVRLLQTLAASMSVALDNARLFDETQRLLEETRQRAKELHLFNRVQEHLVQRLELAEIYTWVGGVIQEYYQPADLSILIYDPATDLLSAPFRVENGSLMGPTTYGVSGKGFFGYVLQHRQPLLINEKMEDAVVNYQNVHYSGRPLPKSALFVPLMRGDAVQGAIALKHMQDEFAFNDTHIRILKTLANTISVAMENARLWEQEQLYRKALEREFEIGHEIQASFLPSTLPQPGGWEIAASLKSAREVTGDFYDAFEMSDGNIGLVIADVCDKGLGAALFMTLFRSLIRAVSNIDFYTNADYGDELSADVRLLNAISLCNNYFAQTHGHTSMFCTIFFGILDTQSGKLSYINGGHLPPLIIGSHGVKEALKATGPAVGVEPGSEYHVGEAVIGVGETLFAHTDGLTDTMNPAGEYFDKAELIPLLKGNEALGSMLEHVQEQVRDYSTGAKQSDDITMLAVRRRAR